MDLHFHPYKIVAVQELSEHDFQNRKDCASLIMNILPNDTIIIISDENFHLSGCVNKQNFWYWVAENLHKLHDWPLHCKCVTVVKFGLICSYFYEKNGRADSVTSVCYA